MSRRTPPAAGPGPGTSRLGLGDPASTGPTRLVQDGTGKGDHPYAAKQAEIYLVAFPELGLLKVGRATPWTVRNRVRDAAEKIRVRHAATAKRLT